ncbi:hypothetical protein DPMN_095319 [Dreissena polymorpha]|uniref:Uncharacterized protein n=1 Tax=Dreissena polymorpha TaxID=45954 RepID=A0A9D4L7P5_DREPO|nr:hypothetical protein DPMN_095319 [Dreissena polymorpha]
MDSLINATNTAFGEKPIVISLPLRRSEYYLNKKAQQLSFEMTSKLSWHVNVTFSNNSNLMFRGRPVDGIMYERKHLSQWGTLLLTKNLKTDNNILLRNKK